MNLKLALKSLVRSIMRLGFIVPIRKNRVFFQAYDGAQYACNPRYIYSFLRTHQLEDKLNVVWSFQRPELFADSVGADVIVRHKSVRWAYYYVTSKVIVSNTRPTTMIPKRKKQIFIETWHGGGAYKEVGSGVLSYTKKRIEQANWAQKIENRTIDYFLSSSAAFTKYGINRGHSYYGRIAETGMPRNDIFFSVTDMRKAREKVLKTFGIQGRIILYAPTWREKSDSERLLSPAEVEKLVFAAESYWRGEKVFFLYRTHHWEKNGVAASEMLLDAGRYEDMQELLCAADILITDYSSSIWDYALTKKPCFLYVPDLRNYKDVSQGIVTPIENWPGKVCESIEGLCSAIRELDEDEHKKRAEKHLMDYGSFETGNACEKTADIILDIIRGS